MRRAAAALLAVALGACRAYDGAAVAGATPWGPVEFGEDQVVQWNLAAGRADPAAIDDVFHEAAKSWGPTIGGWTFSPDGASVAFLGEADVAAHERPVVLAERAAAGTWQFRRVASVRNDPDAETSWSRDGTRFAAMSKEEIVIVDLATRTPHRVQIHPRPGPYYVSPPIALSPDASRVACLYDGHSPLRIVNGEDGVAREITIDGLVDDGAAKLAGWGADGRVRIVAKGEIHVVDPDSGADDVTPFESETVVGASLSPDGAVLLISDGHECSCVYAVLYEFCFKSDAPWTIRTRVFGAFGERELHVRGGASRLGRPWTWRPRERRRTPW